jgi:hypothetical protein
MQRAAFTVGKKGKEGETMEGKRADEQHYYLNENHSRCNTLTELLSNIFVTVYNLFSVHLSSK